jgi:hypothetical protein
MADEDENLSGESLIRHPIGYAAIPSMTLSTTTAGHNYTGKIDQGLVSVATLAQDIQDLMAAGRPETATDSGPDLASLGQPAIYQTPRAFTS